MAIHFFFKEVKNIRLNRRRELKTFITHLFRAEDKIVGSLSYIFCDDITLLSINQDYLQHNYLTDIITFDLSTRDGVVDGEAYVSIERVTENAKVYKVSFEEELHRVIFHGALHLCGFKDKHPADRKIMRKREQNYLTSYFRHVPRIT